jgi:hypothetical protein
MALAAWHNGPVEILKLRQRTGYTLNHRRPNQTRSFIYRLESCPFISGRRIGPIANGIRFPCSVYLERHLVRRSVLLTR